MLTVEKAIEALNLEVINIADVEESFSSVVKILTLSERGQQVLKIPYTKEKFKREVEILMMLSDMPLTPNIIDIWEGDQDHPGAILMTYIDGEPMKLPVDDRMVYEMGRLLGSLHTHPMQNFEMIKESPEDWHRSIKVRFNTWMKEIEGHLSEILYNQCQAYFEKLMECTFSPDGPCLVHFDYRPGNLLVKDNKIVGLIDFESARGASADIDFTKMQEYLWQVYPGTKEQFLTGYTSVRPLPDLETALPIYTFFNAVGGIAWCLRRNKLEDDFYWENYNQMIRCLKGEANGE